ncbi:Helix-turn-helix domain protein,HTH-type transcriptional regulator immR,transcriptional repressor DicA,Predicted transcriptional regulator,putative zinc finger/helix-turn-helix protein, YgiT family,Helix-turn-helix domain [[Clostridium] sordellii]|uniref:helix-turn-helix domain-containing protein n=1 Tax=Paraclostridium sordellii TaxID=1505 RepID=UPI000541EB51|nr:helix-turn-helix transcriptional regulator [Paeniclostridium sordellii]CEK34373.1 Helix-turn-helix domain protein,HTH-type transcriptional regulator immR,transcriptional repressor DicA,Predicted transcriptional regulator,putative zinc finger/helix-turn-helix protein, YgiT family,Helix-turn-helix domain [[Clostridium] sordellii] [Paeniclostridium sordellii]
MKDRLKELRKHFNLTQKEFGDKLNISMSQISSYETGHRNIPDRTISDICRVFKCNKDWLLYGYGEMSIDYTDDLDVDEEVKLALKKLKSLDEDDRVAIQKLIDTAYLKALNSKKEKEI